MRWCLHVDMDAFYASVERALNPALKGKAVIVGGVSGRGVVTSASYEARKFGVHSAMPGFQARKLCPHGIFLPNRHRVYRDFSKKVFAVLGDYSPKVDAISIDEGLVDLTGTEKLLGPPLDTASAILRRIRSELDLPASGGLSTNRVVAKIAATLAKPQGLIFVPAGSEHLFVSPLPVGAIPGVGPKTQKLFQGRGIETVGEVLRRGDLREHYFDFGERGEGARARDHSIGSETTLESPLRELGRMEEILWRLVEEVGARVREDDVLARCITMKIRYTDFHTITRSHTLKIPTRFDREIFDVARNLLRKNLAAGAAVRLLGVSASALVTSGWQESIFDFQKRRSLDKLYEGIDHLRDKYGEETIHSATAHTTKR